MARWSEDYSTKSRYIGEGITTIYSWAGARRGDTWIQTGTLNEPKLIESVTKHVDPGYGAIWYELTFVDGTSARCADNMGFGTIQIGQGVFNG